MFEPEYICPDKVLRICYMQNSSVLGGTDKGLFVSSFYFCV